jgi:hypothetical protein
LEIDQLLTEEPELISSYDDLRARPDFEEALAFFPHDQRRFGAVLAPYRFQDRVSCGIASCRQPHLTGYLISTSDGKETAIGGDCGRTHFGVSFNRERKRIDALIDRRRRIDTITAMIEGLGAMMPLIEQLDRDYQALVQLKQRLMGAIGTVTYQRLKGRAERGYAAIEKEVPMTEREAEAFFATSNRRPDDGLGWPTNTVVLARIDGLDFFKGDTKTLMISNLITPIRNLATTSPADVLTMKPRALGATAKWVGEVPMHLARAQAVVAAGNAFFSASNLQHLALLGASAAPLQLMIETL